MKLQDMDLNDNTAIVRSGKGGKDRMVVICGHTSKDISSYIKVRKHASEYLFPGPSGRPLCNRYVQQIVIRCAKTAGIKKRVTPHTLRHTFATHLLDAGIDIRTIQILLGHEFLETTQIYTHVSALKLRQVSELQSRETLPA